MISVSDIAKLLDQVPLWRTLRALPGRVEKLEERVATLEKALTGKATQPAPCPLCGGAMKTTGVVPHPQFGVMGHQLHTLACSTCDHTEERRVVPGRD